VTRARTPQRGLHIDTASELWIGQFNIVGGHVQEQGPWVSTFQAEAAGEPVRLYVVTEPARPGSEQYTEQLGEAIGTLFSRHDFSITGNMTRALRAAHEHLRDWNRTTMPEEQVGAGVSLLVLREDVGYLAQAGPSIALYGDGTRARRFSAPNGSAQQSIGLAADLRPAVTRIELGLGESVLLSGSALASSLQDEHGPALLGMEPEEALGQVYVMLKEQQNLGAILISHVASGALRPPAPAAGPYPDTEPIDEVLDETIYEAPAEPAAPEPRSRDPFAR
jgi:hypothetical protein